MLHGRYQTTFYLPPSHNNNSTYLTLHQPLERAPSTYGKHNRIFIDNELEVVFVSFFFADVADPLACSTFSYLSVFIVPEVSAGQQTNLAKVPVTPPS